MADKKVETFYPRSRADWRSWLQEHHETSQSVWVGFYKKSADIPTLSWGDAVSEALCFGWIDSLKKSIDEQRYIQFFSRRKPKSTWSKINKEKVEKLIAAGLMTEAGLKTIEIAKQNGSWNFLDEVEALIIPPDLEKAFADRAGSKDYFLSLSKSTKKGILHWILMARRPETRRKRIAETASLAGQQQKPRQFR